MTAVRLLCATLLALAPARVPRRSPAARASRARSPRPRIPATRRATTRSSPPTTGWRPTATSSASTSTPARRRATTPDGLTTATPVSTGHAYKTRLVVRRPKSARDFNGTVIVEWYNVSNQYDQEVDWLQTHEHLVREGYAWVGVSAQRAGIHSATGLRAWNPDRYGSLDVTAGGTITDDSLSYDVFSQAAAALEKGPLGSLKAAARARHRPLAVGRPPAHLLQLDPPAGERLRRLRHARHVRRHVAADRPRHAGLEAAVRDRRGRLLRTADHASRTATTCSRGRSPAPRTATGS